MRVGNRVSAVDYRFRRQRRNNSTSWFCWKYSPVMSTNLLVWAVAVFVLLFVMRWNYYTLEYMQIQQPDLTKVKEMPNIEVSLTENQKETIESVGAPLEDSSYSQLAKDAREEDKSKRVDDDIEYIDDDENADEQEALEAIERSYVDKDEVKPEKFHLTIFTGTHVFPEWEKRLPMRKQAPICFRLSMSIEALWTAWSSADYISAKSQVLEDLLALRQQDESCILGENVDGNLRWTFPLSYDSKRECDTETAQILRRGTWLRGTKVLVPWFLLRPDIVTLESLLSKLNLSFRVVISIGHDPKSSAFAQEGCPRFMTILSKREIYRQRLLLVALSDVAYQLRKLSKRTTTIKHVCSAGSVGTETIRFSRSASQLENIFGAEGLSLRCDARRSLSLTKSNSHIQSILSMGLFNAEPVQKTVFDGSTTLVFIAGLEGVGHHLFAKLGAKHTVRELYDSLTNYLCDSAWNDNSEKLYPKARARLMNSMRKLKSAPSFPDGSRVFFLNTVFSEKAVNMYSYPWGGPRCYLKRFARVVCNIDTIELAKIAEEAGIDFRIVTLRRSIGAAVVSASLHRPYGTLVSETRMLIESWALLRMGLDTIDQKFVLDISYEEILNNPRASADRLSDHLNVPSGSPLHQHFQKVLDLSAASHPVGNISKWKVEVGKDDLEYMEDILYLNKLPLSRYS